MSRKNALAHIRVAGYHDDKAALVRLYVSNRISYPVALKEFNSGAKARADGATKCTCYDCKQKENAK